MRFRHVCVILLVVPMFMLATACSEEPGHDNDGGPPPGKEGGPPLKDVGPGSDVPTKPITPDPTDYTYKLSESTTALPLWTTPCTHKVLTSERAPTASRSGLKLSAARNEFEPVQIILGPGSGTVKVAIKSFPKLGSGQRVTLARAGYVSGWAEKLTPLSSGGNVTLSASQGQPVWLTVYVPAAAPAGEHTTTLTLTPAGGAAISVPVTLYVFDFSLPKSIGFYSQLNIDIKTLAGGASAEQKAKTLLYEHRLTPKSVPWPSGFNYKITWDNSQSTNTCNILWDEPNEQPPYSIKHLAKKYLLGSGWNGAGFPTAMLFQFVDNATPRPSTFCGISRGSGHNGTSAYNTEWSQFLTALQAYLEQNGYAKKGYYYVQNEPQNAADHKLAAHLCRLTKKAAPKLRIAISEEPKKEIAEDSGGACGYDIWIAHIRAYQQTYAQQRQQQHGEEVWFYSLDQDPDPYFNPTRVDRQGMHQRIIPWVSWHYRAYGWAYYDANRFFDGTRPTIRAELLREGFEDYEYLLLANKGLRPRVKVAEAADKTVDSVASSLTSWTKNADALMGLRHELGRYIEGKLTSMPVLKVESTGRKRGAYNINFQDPKGKPTATPLKVGGKTYIKVGWSKYDSKTQLGWSGQYIGNAAIMLYGYDAVSGFNEAQRSFIFDDYGRDNLFEFGLENGKYKVTVGVGRPAAAYPNDPHNVTIEGIKAVDDEPTTSSNKVIVKSVTVDLKDGSLSLEVGGKSQKTNDWAYTFLAYLLIEPV
jgi:hypothetical protein